MRSLTSPLSTAVLSVSLLWGTSAFGQATFQVSSTSAAVNSTGHTELAGNVTFTVSSGTTAAGTIEVTYAAELTNDAASGITVSGTGGLAGATLGAVIPENGIIFISVPAGATVGSTATLTGVRISAANLATATSVDVTVSSTANSIVAGQNRSRVVHSIVNPLLVAETSGTIVSFVNGVLVTSPSAIVFREGHDRSFTSDVGTFGQTVSTQVIFKVTGLPDNVFITFPAQVVTDSGATLLTTSGTDEMLTNQSPTDRVIYTFTDSVTSAQIIDEFRLTPTVGTTGVPRTGTVFIQLTAGPLGAAKPTTQLPSTAIPRFKEQFLPSINVPAPIPTRFFFPVAAPITAEGIAITNTSTGGASIILRARREDGTLAANGQAIINMLARETTTFTLNQAFGSALDVSQVASVEVESQNDRVIATSFTVFPGGPVVTGAYREFARSYLPFDRTSTEVPVIALNSAGTTSADVLFRLRSSLGQTVASANRTIVGDGGLRTNLTALFGVPMGAIPLSGYVEVDSAVPMRTAIFNNPSSGTDGTAGLLPVARSPMIFPFFAFGGGYNSVIGLVNTSQTVTARVGLTLNRPDGTSLSQTPVLREIAPLNRVDFDLRALFGTSASPLTTGHVVLTVQPVSDNPFASLPTLIGSVRISTGTGSVVAPLSADAGTEFFITPTSETSALYSGFAVANDGAQATTITVESYSRTGVFLGSATLPLGGNASASRLLRELVPNSLVHSDGFVRLSSSGPINVVAFRGNLAASELLLLPLHRIP